MPDAFYDSLATAYDAIIDWERRLAVETPIFARWWECWKAERGALPRVLDAACGSGGHLELMVRQGLTPVGADASEAMLARAALRLSELPPPQRPRLVRAKWDELPQRLHERFDVVLCLGNSLPAVTEASALEASLAGLWGCVAEGGRLIVQYKNFAKLRADGVRLLPLVQHADRETGRETIALRLYEWHPGQVQFHVMLIERAERDAPWSLRHWVTPLATWPPEAVEAPLRAWGAAIRRCGSLALDPFDPHASDDVVLVAERPVGRGDQSNSAETDKKL